MAKNILIEHDAGSSYALVKRVGEGIPQPYVSAWGYDPESGTWGQGHYFATLEAARAHYRSKTEGRAPRF